MKLSLAIGLAVTPLALSLAIGATGASGRILAKGPLKQHSVKEVDRAFTREGFPLEVFNANRPPPSVNLTATTARYFISVWVYLKGYDSADMWPDTKAIAKWAHVAAARVDNVIVLCEWATARAPLFLERPLSACPIGVRNALFRLAHSS